ncbi:MAG: sugar ABC transporter substrate-binding protein [Chloroflexi bacterium]|nr:sugar ABC transporter substrate-binding protein [Chloroflexota bacterium]
MSRVMTRRRLLKAVAAGAGAAALAACQPQQVEVVREVEKIVEQTVVVEKVKEVVIIRMHSRLGDAQRTVYDGGIARMEAAHPEVKVNVEEFPAGSAEYGPKIAAMVAGGAVGDITWNAIGTGSFQFLAFNKALASLEEQVAADKSGFTLDEFFPTVVKGFRMGPSGQGSGDLYGLPTLTHGVQVCLWFNRDLIEGAGVEAPTDDWTRDQLFDMATKVTTEGVFGFLPATGDYSNHRNHTLAFGGEIISEDGTKATIADEPCRAAFQWVHDCFFKAKVAPTASQIQGNTDQMFLAGKLAAYQSGGWALVTMRNVIKDAFQWDMVPMPKGPAGLGSHVHADSFAVFSLSKNKPLAYELCKFLTDKEAGVGYASLMGLACRFDTFQDERITKDPLLLKIGETTEAAVEHRGSANLRKQELQTTVAAIMSPVWTGDTPLDDAFYAEATKTLQTFLDKPAG